jgi:hypothetical protein
MKKRILPIGIQDFKSLREDGYLYVDKTAFVYKLATEGRPYFLGRPRRFGKSLLLSTLKYYFLGEKEIFEGLAIEKLEKEWIEHPVFYFDFNVGLYNFASDLESAINITLCELEEIWGKNAEEISVVERFRGLIKRAYEKSGQRVVVLVDEYDKPLLGVMDNLQVQDDMRKLLKGFYGVLKSADQYLRFAFLTGVTKFSKVSIFSDLNQLNDISMSEIYSEICGITEEELRATFEPELQGVAKRNNLSYEACLVEMKKRYDGYHFASVSEGVYNPFSVLGTLDRREFVNYWYQTGTPTVLINALKDKDTDIDVMLFSKGYSTPLNKLTDTRADYKNPIPILYQSGYLTIKGYDSMLNSYILGYPNEEVKYGFLENLWDSYLSPSMDENTFSASRFMRNLIDGDVESMMNRLQAFYAGIPYDLNNKNERHYQTIFYLLFTLLGQYVTVESHSAKGSADAIVVVQDTIYIFEFKLSGNGTAKDALQQIDEKGYAKPYLADGKKIVKIGALFSGEERNVVEWVME